MQRQICGQVLLVGMPARRLIQGAFESSLSARESEAQTLTCWPPSRAMTTMAAIKLFVTWGRGMGTVYLA